MNATGYHGTLKRHVESDNFIDLVESADHRKLFEKARERVRKLHDSSEKRNEPFKRTIDLSFIAREDVP